MENFSTEMEETECSDLGVKRRLAHQNKYENSEGGRKITDQIVQTTENQTTCMYMYVKTSTFEALEVQHSGALFDLVEDRKQHDVEKLTANISQGKYFSLEKIFERSISGIQLRKYLLPLMIIFESFSGCSGIIVKQSKDLFELVGNNATFRCVSDLTDKPIWWYHSGVRQQEVKLVSNESSVNEEFRRRFASHILPSANPNEKHSMLTIKNVAMANAGYIYCKDDGDFGKYELFKLSVATGVDCGAACVNDNLFVTCSTCYWSEDNLQFVIQVINHKIDILPNSSFTKYRSEGMCLNYEAFWNFRAQCQDINKEPITVNLKYNNSAEVVLQASDSTLLNVFVKVLDIHVAKNESSQTAEGNGSLNSGCSAGPNAIGDFEIKGTTAILLVVAVAFLGVSTIVLVVTLFLCPRKFSRNRRTKYEDYAPAVRSTCTCISQSIRKRHYFVGRNLNCV